MIEKVFDDKGNESLRQVYTDVCGYEVISDYPYKNKKLAKDIWDNAAIFESECVGLGYWSVTIVSTPKEKEYLLGLYQDAHNDLFVRLNIGRYLVVQKQCLLELNKVFLPKQLAPLVSVEKVTIALSMQHDSIQKFTPSPLLVRLIRNHMIEPDEMTLKMLEQMRKMRPDADSQKQDIEAIVSEQIENLLTDSAKRISINGEPLVITLDRRFSSEICTEIISRLELDYYNPTPVLDLLYRELINFASYPREREWGTIIVEDSKIKLIVKKDAFKIPVISSIDKDLWIKV